jgi:hypothetical protein
MEPTHEQDRHRNPISIGSSSSLSSPPALWNKVNRGVVKLPQGASSVRSRQIASTGRIQQWIDDLSSSKIDGADTGSFCESSYVNVGVPLVSPIADFSHNTGRPLAPPSINTDGQLVHEALGLAYNLGPPQALPPAEALQSVLFNREPAPEPGK